MTSLQDDAQSDEKQEALEKMKWQEKPKSGETIKVGEESESEGLITGGGKWVFGKRLAEGTQQKCEEIIHDDDDREKSAGCGTKTEQKIKDKKKLKGGKIIEVAETVKDTEALQRSSLDVTYVGNPVMEEINNPTEGRQPPSPSEDLSTALFKVHISSTPPRLRSKRGDGQGGYNRGRERRRGKPKPASPEQPKEVPMKNAVMMLNEMFPPPGAAQYKVLSMTGAPNNPTFSMVCCIEGQEFEGSGRSKKEAKLAASQLALTTLFGKVAWSNKTIN